MTKRALIRFLVLWFVLFIILTGMQVHIAQAFGGAAVGAALLASRVRTTHHVIFGEGVLLGFAWLFYCGVLLVALQALLGPSEVGLVIAAVGSYFPARRTQRYMVRQQAEGRLVTPAGFAAFLLGLGSYYVLTILADTAVQKVQPLASAAEPLAVASAVVRLLALGPAYWLGRQSHRFILASTLGPHESARPADSSEHGP